LNYIKKKLIKKNAITNVHIQVSEIKLFKIIL
jgi:hypothetical protein